jgi:hypothetical protein
VEELKLDSLYIDPSYRKLVDDIQTDNLKSVVAAFIQNINQLAALSKMPVKLFYWGSVIGQNFVVAYQDVTKKKFVFPPDSKTLEENISLIVERERIWTSKMVEQLKVDEERQTKVEKDSYQELLFLLPLDVPLADSTKAILFAVVIGAWTAFETLASDAWIGAYDALPREAKRQCGDQLRIQNRMKPNPDGQTSGKKKAEKFQDNTGLSGEELVSEKEIWFSKLEWTRHHYCRLFSEKLRFCETDSIDRVLADIRLDGVNLVRNLLIHKFGIADDKYVRDSKLYPLAPQLELGASLALDGVSASEFVSVVTELGTKLAKAVDAWTQATKTQ